MSIAHRARGQAMTPVVWVLLALAVALRLWLIADKNLWLDESISWQFATGSVADLIHGTAADIHPPLYYLLLKVWIVIAGDSLIGLRSLSVVFGVAAVYLLSRLLETVPRLVAYAAILWFVVAPHAVLFSQEARMYAAVTACILGACVAYRRWVDSGFTNGVALTWYAACVTVSLYLHYFTALAIAAICLHAILLATGVTRTPSDPPQRLPLTSWLLVHAVVAAIYLPWVATAASQIRHGQSWRELVTMATIPASARDMLAGLLGGFTYLTVASPWMLAALAVLAVGLARLALAAAQGREPERDLFFLIVALVPVLLGLALLPFAGRMDLSRYLPYALPLLIAAGARGWALMPLRPLAAGAAVAVGALAMLPALGKYYGTHLKDSDPRPIVATLLKDARVVPGSQDAIFVAPGFMETVLQYISRDALVYQRVDDGADVFAAIEPHLAPTHATWLVVDYRSPEFATLSQNPRVVETSVTGGFPDKVKLYRVH